LKFKTDFHFANVAGFCVLVDIACMCHASVDVTGRVLKFSLS